MSLNLYPSVVHERGVSRDVASAEIDDLCQAIHDACKGFGTNEKYVARYYSFFLLNIAGRIGI